MSDRDSPRHLPELNNATLPMEAVADGRVVREVVVTSSGAVDGLPPGTRLGDWRIEGKIGEGGMGTVHAAVHTVIGKRAAIKVVRADLCRTPLTAERFVQEARVVNQIGHPNIVDIFHIGKLDDGRQYLVMELLHGKTLRTRIDEGRLSPLAAIDVLLEIAAASAAAHACGVVHRDLKPENIFLVDGPGGGVTVKVVDWGIAKLYESSTARSSVELTTTGVILGTPQYVSPEQARGRVVDARSDIYSLGAIAYEMFLEAPPFVADNVADIVAMHLLEPPPSPSDVWPEIPPLLERLLLAMLAKDAADRPGLAEVATTLNAVRADLQIRIARPSGRMSALGSVPPPMGEPALGTSGALPVRSTMRPTPMSQVAVDLAALGLERLEEPGRRQWPWVVAGVLAAAAVAAYAVWTRTPPSTSSRAAAPTAPAAEIASPPEPAPAVVPAAPAPAHFDRRPPGRVELTVRVEPADAQVHIDGIRAEVRGGRVIWPTTAGAHQLEVSARGFVTQRRTVDLTAAMALEIALTPVRSRGRAVPGPPASEGPKPASAVDRNSTIDPF